MEAGHSDSVLQGEVLNALQSLHSLGAPPEARRLAGHWLLEFQASPSAWGVCHRLLQNGAAPAEYSLFAAQTLRRKIRCQLDTLPRALWPELRNALFVHVLTHRQGPLPVIAQLCLCLVSLAVIWEEWDDALRAVGDVLPPMAFLLFLEQVAEESVDGLWLQSSGIVVVAYVSIYLPFQAPVLLGDLFANNPVVSRDSLTGSDGILVFVVPQWLSPGLNQCPIESRYPQTYS